MGAHCDHDMVPAGGAGGGGLTGDEEGPGLRGRGLTCEAAMERVTMSWEALWRNAGSRHAMDAPKQEESK